MKHWHRLTKRHPRRTLEAHLELIRAYQEVFAGMHAEQQKQMVLADLAHQCGFYKVSPEDTEPRVVAYREGKRAAFAEIFSHLSLNDEDITALANAARHEAAASDNN